jgi:RNA polymerase sigma-70 factor, ECF subfamily
MLGRPNAAAIEHEGELERDLEAFFADHYDRLVRLAALICHAASTTEDAVQAAMEQAWRRRGTLRDRALLKPWLDQIVVREAIRVNAQPWWSRFSRGSSVRQIEPVALQSDDMDDRAQHPRSGSRSSAPADAGWLALTVAFRGLPTEQRAVVALHLYAGYSVEETARLMGAGLETTRSRLRLARERLRRELREDER